MFAGLKNKIKEETGSDPTKLLPSPNLTKLNVSQDLNKKEQAKRGMFHGASLETLTNSAQENNKPLSSDVPVPTRSRKTSEANGQVKQAFEDELTKHLEKKEKEWKKLLVSKESEWNKALKVLEKEKAVLEEEKLDLLKQNLVIEDSLKAAEDYKKKIFQYREDIDQLEGFQTQELAKIKHLLLAKEQEVTEMTAVIKENSGQIETLQAEVKRLQRYEAELINVQDELEDLRHSYNQEKCKLTTGLAEREEEARHLRDRVAILEQRHLITPETETDEKVQMLIKERTLLEQRLEEVHLHLSDIKTSWSEKISALETQVGRLSRQAGEEGMERRRTEMELSSMVERIRALQELLVEANVSVKSSEEAVNRLTDERDTLLEELAKLRESHNRETEGLLKQIDEASDKVRNLTVLLVEAERQAEASKTECLQLTSELEEAKSSSCSLGEEVSHLQDRLDREKTRVTELGEALEREQSEKDSMLLRNAQLNQDVELTKQELRSHETELLELQTRLTTMEATIAEKDKELNLLKTENAELQGRIEDVETAKANERASSAVEHELRRNISDLEDQLSEKVKAIKVLQQHMGDLKKTLQRELRQSSEDTESNAAILTPSSNRHIVVPTSGNLSGDEGDVNFKYLKHVIIKFFTSREYEAQHLTRAVATLLRFSPEEERLLRETLDWKMSWFGTRPRLGFGQTSKTIPPS